ncbi:helix-turn-helix domain-containing protein [Aliicoccus persicus]
MERNIQMNNIGIKIKERRKLMALSQTQLAARAHVSQTMISRLENQDNTIPLEHFISIINVLSIDVTEVVPNATTEKVLIAMHMLDSARATRDLKSIRHILNSHPISFWNKSPELQIYKTWHEAIIDYHNGDVADAISKIKRLINQYMDIPGCYEIMAQVLNNYGNILTEPEQRVRVYTHAKKMFLKSAQQNYKTYINILVNLANLYCEMSNYKQSLRHVNEGYKVLHSQHSTFHLTKLIIIECNAHHFQKNYSKCMEILMGAQTIFMLSEQLELWQRYKELFTGE